MQNRNVLRILQKASAIKISGNEEGVCVCVQHSEFRQKREEGLPGRAK